ncbi:UNVERIFIED_CONTAM: hypothetical protein HDU68_012904, partial [Siphonaria sp. JEL0065]
MVVSQQVSVVALFVGLFRSSWLEAAVVPVVVVVVLAGVLGAKAGLLVAAILSALTPMLRTLTKDTSSDTIAFLALVLFGVHVLCADYASTAASIGVVAFPASVSINAAVFAAVLLASRLDASLRAVSALLLAAVALFALFPVLRRNARLCFPQNVDVLIALLLAALSLAVLAKAVSLTACAVHLAVLVFVSFVCPAWFLHVQIYK